MAGSCESATTHRLPAHDDITIAGTIGKAVAPSSPSGP